MAGAAVWILERELGGLHPREVVAAVARLPVMAIWAAIGLTAISYAILTVYDALALRYLEHPLPYRRSAFAAFLGYAISQNVGLSVVSGAPVRYRLYAGWGVSMGEIAGVVAFNAVTYWLGLLATAGTALALGGPALVSGTLPVSGDAVRGLGIAAVAVAAAYLVLCHVRTEPLTVGRWTLDLPRRGIAVAQLGLGVVDWIVAAAVLWVLVQTQAPVGFFHLVAVFVVAQLVGVLSQVPGGLGVFESVVLVLLPEAVSSGSGVAVLLAYRAAYYLLPLVVAVVLLLGSELWVRRRGIGIFARWAGGWLGVVAPRLLAAATAVTGGLMVVTGSLPALPERIRWLEGMVPLAAVEVSHFLASVIGMVLVVVAWGLERRLRAAWWLTAIGLAVGVLASLVRAGHPAMALASAVTLAALLPARPVFSRRAALLSEPLSLRWLIGVAMVAVGAVWVGLFVYRGVAYSSDLWWRFSLHGDAPRFLRAMVGAAAVVLAAGVVRLLAPGRPRPTAMTDELKKTVSRLVTESPNASAHLALLGDKQVMLSESGDAFLMYGVQGGSWIAMGDPVGAPEAHAELIWHFRAISDGWGARTVFYEVGDADLGTYLELGLAAFKIGEEASVPLTDFSLEGSRRKDLRNAIRRVEREGGDFEVIPAVDVPDVLPELRHVSDAWPESKRTREKRFSLGWFDEQALCRRPVAVVRVAGKIVAFSNLWPSAPGGELSIDLMRSVDNAPKGVMEYLFVQLMLWGRAGGWSRFGLGMAPLAGVRSGPLTPMWNRLAETVWRFGGPFYNFQGLRQYKEKFDPVWEPRYLVCPSGAVVPAVLADLAALVSGGPLGVVMR
jgi:phosphatidylglycerol lysyltransferase